MRNKKIQILLVFVLAIGLSVCFSIGDTGKKADGELKRVAGNVQGV